MFARRLRRSGSGHIEIRIANDDRLAAVPGLLSESQKVSAACEIIEAVFLHHVMSRFILQGPEGDQVKVAVRCRKQSSPLPDDLPDGRNNEIIEASAFPGQTFLGFRFIEDLTLPECSRLRDLGTEFHDRFSMAASSGPQTFSVILRARVLRGSASL